jgi:transcription initiation factor TFIIF subunit beta
MPQNELLDLLFKCFKEWKHWHLKDIKARVQQPEAYLRQTLDMIAEMVKSGTYAGTWRLRRDANFAEYNADMHDFEQAQEGKAPDGAFGVDGASDIGDIDKSEDEDEVKMEDVLPR